MGAWHELEGIVWREGDQATIAYGNGAFLEVVVALNTAEEVAAAAGLVRVPSAEGTVRWARPPVPGQQVSGMLPPGPR